MKQLLFSAPGRVELGGNHTDHQHGCVLAAAINLQTKARVMPNSDNCLRIRSEGYPAVEVGLSSLEIRPEERNTTAALVRGVAAGFQKRGCKLTGFDAELCSEVLSGSGLSSSACFEVLLAQIINELCFQGRLMPIELAIIGQEAENDYFGKPCGLMDQAACAIGGLLKMDFANPAEPAVKQLSFDFEEAGYKLCVVNTGADHAELTAAYAAIPAEMGLVSGFFGKQTLHEVSEELFYSSLPTLREKLPDRAILRAIHFFGENRRVREQEKALICADTARFMELVRESGRSSWMYLQNVISEGSVQRQSMALALALCERLLSGKGAFRVHGGGFAGTVLAFVPKQELRRFTEGIQNVFGRTACQALSVRTAGAIREE